MYGMHKKITSALVFFTAVALFLSAPLFAESHIQSADGKAQARIEKIEQLLLEYDRTLPLAEAATGDVELLFQFIRVVVVIQPAPQASRTMITSNIDDLP